MKTRDVIARQRHPVILRLRSSRRTAKQHFTCRIAARKRVSRSFASLRMTEHARPFGAPRNDCRGFTLIELIMTSILVGMIVGTLWMIFNVSLKTVYTQDTRVRIKGEVERAFFGIEKELREATSVTSAEEEEVIFTVDTDDDGLGETIEYSLTGTSLNRISGTVTVPVVTAVDSFVISYYDSADALLTPPAPPAQVRKVALDLVAVDQDEIFRLRTQVRLRNL